MTNEFLSFLTGLLVGGTLGVFFMCLIIASVNSRDRRDEEGGDNEQAN